MTFLQANLQLAISANAAIRGILSKPGQDTSERLKEATSRLEELIDNLETDLVKAASTASNVRPEFLYTIIKLILKGIPKPALSTSAHSHETTVAAQWSHIEQLTELLRQKETAMQQAAADHQELLRRLCAVHEETIRSLRQSGEYIKPAG